VIRAEVEAKDARTVVRLTRHRRVLKSERSALESKAACVEDPWIPAFDPRRTCRCAAQIGELNTTEV
jgi:hypothetical protein